MSEGHNDVIDVRASVPIRISEYLCHYIYTMQTSYTKTLIKAVQYDKSNCSLNFKTDAFSFAFKPSGKRQRAPLLAFISVFLFFDSHIHIQFKKPKISRDLPLLSAVFMLR